MMHGSVSARPILVATRTGAILFQIETGSKDKWSFSELCGRPLRETFILFMSEWSGKTVKAADVQPAYNDICPATWDHKDEEDPPFIVSCPDVTSS